MCSQSQLSLLYNRIRDQKTKDQKIGAFYIKINAVYAYNLAASLSK